MPAPDDLNRDEFYTSDEDDGDEYELEGPDPEVLAAERRRQEEDLATLRRSIDIDEIYKEEERSRSSEILHDWAKGFRGGLRFQVKHLLIATAVLAIGLTLWKLQVFGTALVLLVMISIIGVYLYLQWKEKQHYDEVVARRHEMYAQRRIAQHNPAALENATATANRSAPRPPLKAEVDQVWQEAAKAQEWRFQFSLFQMMMTMTGAAATLGFIYVLGPQNAATLLGLVALIGLVAHAAGFHASPIVALAWWLLLLFYVLLSFAAVLWNSL